MRSKKIIFVLFTFVLFMLPLATKANIMCNDGTHSPTCQDCHQGCCSHHGGCANYYDYDVYDDEDDDDEDDLDDLTDDEEEEESTDSTTWEIVIFGLICCFVYALIKK